jgi:hypothetical protein
LPGEIDGFETSGLTCHDVACPIVSVSMQSSEIE